MSAETERRIDAVMIALNGLRREGFIPTGARVSPALMAYVSEVIGEPVSKSTFTRLTKRAATRIRTNKLARLALEAYLAQSTSHEN